MITSGSSRNKPVFFLTIKQRGQVCVWAGPALQGEARVAASLTEIVKLRRHNDNNINENTTTVLIK